MSVSERCALCDKPVPVVVPLHELSEHTQCSLGAEGLILHDWKGTVVSFAGPEGADKVQPPPTPPKKKLAGLQLHFHFWMEIVTMHLLAGMDTPSEFALDYAYALQNGSKRPNLARKHEVQSSSLQDETKLLAVRDYASISGLDRRRSLIWMQLSTSRSAPFENRLIGMRIWRLNHVIPDRYTDITHMFVGHFAAAYEAFRGQVLPNGGVMRKGDGGAIRFTQDNEAQQRQSFQECSRAVAFVYRQRLMIMFKVMFPAEPDAMLDTWMIKQPYNHNIAGLPFVGWPDNWGQTIDADKLYDENGYVVDTSKDVGDYAANGPLHEGTAHLMTIFSPIPLKKSESALKLLRDTLVFSNHYWRFNVWCKNNNSVFTTPTQVHAFPGTACTDARHFTLEYNRTAADTQSQTLRIKSFVHWRERWNVFTTVHESTLATKDRIHSIEDEDLKDAELFKLKMHKVHIKAGVHIKKRITVSIRQAMKTDYSNTGRRSTNENFFKGQFDLFQKFVDNYKRITMLSLCANEYMVDAPREYDAPYYEGWCRELSEKERSTMNIWFYPNESGYLRDVGQLDDLLYQFSEIFTNGLASASDLQTEPAYQTPLRLQAPRARNSVFVMRGGLV
jgi:hypothetical protein